MPRRGESGEVGPRERVHMDYEEWAREETAAFFWYVWGRASGLLFLEGRLTFHRPDGSPGRGNSGGPSVLISYGEECLERLAKSGLRGSLVRGGGERVGGRHPGLGGDKEEG